MSPGGIQAKRLGEPQELDSITKTLSAAGFTPIFCLEAGSWGKPKWLSRKGEVLSDHRPTGLRSATRVLVHTGQD
jgi:hypothetical protein